MARLKTDPTALTPAQRWKARVYDNADLHDYRLTLTTAPERHLQKAPGCDNRVFHAACRELGEIVQAAKAAQKTLAERAFNALNENDYGQYDEMISVLSPALGPTGLEELEKNFIALSKAPPEQPKGLPQRHRLGHWRSALCRRNSASRRESTIRLALQEIADAQGDVDAFIAQQSEKAKTVPRVAAKIAQRLLEAGRADEAWSAINAVDEKRLGWIPFEWEQVRLEVREALGRNVEAQAFRWQCFERTLSIAHLPLC